jgi:hypothetical protein
MTGPPTPRPPPRGRDGPGAPDRKVVLRDLLIFQLKLALDGVKDMVLSPLAIGATVLDFFAGPGPHGPRLYGVLRLGERFDLWLNLYGAAEAAGRSPEGLFGASRAGSDTLLGRLEEWSRGGPEPEEVEDPSEPPEPPDPA